MSHCSRRRDCPRRGPYRRLCCNGTLRDRGSKRRGFSPDTRKWRDDACRDPQGSGLLGAGRGGELAAAHAGDDALLLGEAPFVGNRLIELARREADAAECFLAARTTLFIVPAPTLAVRRAIEPRVSGNR